MCKRKISVFNMQNTPSSLRQRFG
ncbi:hypothetical protein HOQ51_gp53 [uncultured phage_MedDCM-OCT-S35-C6]|nr:hypothetical protein HOQ51_gp53 [uncultured phage_MedDCM-OCT-S35-C6]